MNLQKSPPEKYQLGIQILHKAVVQQRQASHTHTHTHAHTHKHTHSCSTNGTRCCTAGATPKAIINTIPALSGSAIQKCSCMNHSETGATPLPGGQPRPRFQKTTATCGHHATPRHEEFVGYGKHSRWLPTSLKPIQMVSLPKHNAVMGRNIPQLHASPACSCVPKHNGLTIHSGPRN